MIGYIENGLQNELNVLARTRQHLSQLLVTMLKDPLYFRIDSGKRELIFRQAVEANRKAWRGVNIELNLIEDIDEKEKALEIVTAILVKTQ